MAAGVDKEAKCDVSVGFMSMGSQLDPMMRMRVLGMIFSLSNLFAQGGRTALMHASEGGHLGVVRALLAAGADVGAKSDVSGRVM